MTIFAITDHDRCWMLVAIASFREVRMIYSCIQLKTANLKNGKWFSKGTHSHTCKAGQPQNHTTKLRPKLTIAEYMSHKIWPPPFNGILLPKLFWPTVRKNCSRVREKVLRSLEQFILTAGQNNFGNKIPSLACKFLKLFV